MNVLQELSDQHLSCSICMELYTDPKQLPCLHNFCKQCLSTHILKKVAGSGDVAFPCPVCRNMCKPANPDPSKIMEWVDSFPDNFFIKNLMDTFETQSRTTGSMTVEDQLQALVVEAETCPRHKKENVLVYCTVKKGGACGLCLQSSIHDDCAKSHLTLDKAQNLAGNRLKDFKKRVGTLSSRIETVNQKLSSKPDELKFKKEELALEISQHFTDLKTKINKLLLQKEKETMKELKSVMDQESKKVTEAKGEATSISGSLKNTEQLFEKLIQSRPTKTLSLADRVEEQLATYERGTMKAEKVCDGLDIKLHQTEDNLTAMKNMQWGRILVGENVDEVTDAQLFAASSMQTAPSVAIQSLPVLSVNKDGSTHAEKLPPREACTAGASVDALSTKEQRDLKKKLCVENTSVKTNVTYPKVEPQPSVSPRTEVFQTQSDPRQRDFVSATVSNSTQHENSPQATASAVSNPTNVAPSPEFQLNPTHDFNGLCPNDVHSASYVGVCPFGQNCLLILDRWNKKLKLIQIGGRRLLVYAFADTQEPWDVTYISQDSVAVTCPSTSYILTISVTSSSIDISRFIKTVVGYSAVAHLDGHRFAAGVCKPFGMPRVDILDCSSDNANILRELPSNVTYPRTMDLTLNKDLFICDWSLKEISVFDKNDFTQKLRYKGSGREGVLREPVGTTKDRRGNLYIADRKTKKIHVISSTTGSRLGLLTLDIPSDPKVIVIAEAERRYSSSGEVLVVATGSGRLFVYDLITPDIP
ncbi:E3 ubiquitin-protein ligase TRIM56-like [Haliotis rubra]|uniref:E3 ubiquitin-protein ligase TRIM56-like n=1 Tax=Haliotis rubra TaxID=36100 RepID=UPI001EE56EDD|nr:E3 ubiquitin-protein ligase TRIM56-like [Haliotis rubra]XP_046548763.1 E3 ubiquitin-protein ligase TRIM56-like [Haliotis rubra]XP_046548764.1 E3 ubiquitin-protein ligase TRIM56-like [Haliotis rubra]